MTYYRIRLSYDLKYYADLLKVFFTETEGRERYIPLYNTRRLREVSYFSLQRSARELQAHEPR